MFQTRDRSSGREYRSWILPVALFFVSLFAAVRAVMEVSAEPQRHFLTRLLGPVPTILLLLAIAAVGAVWYLRGSVAFPLRKVLALALTVLPLAGFVGTLQANGEGTLWGGVAGRNLSVPLLALPTVLGTGLAGLLLLFTAVMAARLAFLPPRPRVETAADALALAMASGTRSSALPPEARVDRIPHPEPLVAPWGASEDQAGGHGTEPEPEEQIEEPPPARVLAGVLTDEDESPEVLLALHDLDGEEARLREVGFARLEAEEGSAHRDRDSTGLDREEEEGSEAEEEAEEEHFLFASRSLATEEEDEETEEEPVSDLMATEALDEDFDEDEEPEAVLFQRGEAADEEELLAEDEEEDMEDQDDEAEEDEDEEEDDEFLEEEVDEGTLDEGLVPAHLQTDDRESERYRASLGFASAGSRPPGGVPFWAREVPAESGSAWGIPSHLRGEEIESPSPTRPDEAGFSQPTRSERDWAAWQERRSAGGDLHPHLSGVGRQGLRPDEGQAPLFSHRSEVDEALFRRALDLVAAEERCSVTMLQRKLSATFSEATVIIDRLQEEGVVGPLLPSGQREYLGVGRQLRASMDTAET